MVHRFGTLFLTGILALTALLTTDVMGKGSPNSSTNTGIHASIDLRTLSQAKDEIFD